MANLGSKSKGPFGTLGRNYKVVSTVPAIFSLYCTMSHVPPSPSTGKKRWKHPRLYALFKHTYNAQIFKKIHRYSLTLYEQTF